MKNSLFITALLTLLSTFATRAEAQSRTVCVNLGYLDQRVRCPGAPGVNTSGARTTCNNGGTSSLLGMSFELWDQDPTGDPDDLIGKWRTVGPGVNCGTFNWTDTADPPDVYVKFFPRGTGEGGGPVLQAKQNVGTATSPNWQDYLGYTTRGWGVANDCGAGATCTILPGQTVLPSSDPASEDSGIFAALDSAIRALRVFHSAINGTGAIDMQIDQLSQWPVGPQRCPTACAASRTLMRVPFDSARHLDGDRLSHEVGHVLQMREFGRMRFTEQWSACVANQSRSAREGQDVSSQLAARQPRSCRAAPAG